MHEFERWPDYTEQSWQQRFVTLDAKYKERGDAMIEAAYAHANEIATLQAKLDKALDRLVKDSAHVFQADGNYTGALLVHYLATMRADILEAKP